MENSKQFLVSVADVIARDTKTKQILFLGKTLVNSNIKQSIQGKEITGGYGGAVQYEYNYGKKLELDIEDCQFKETFIALNNGVGIKNELSEYFAYSEPVIINDGKGELKHDAIGTVYVEMPDETSIVVTPVGREISIPVENGAEILVTYQYRTSVDTIKIDGNNYPNSIDLTLVAKIFNESGQTKEIQIHIPRYKVSGNMDIALTQDGVTGSKLNGKALADGKGEYAKIKIKHIEKTEVPVTSIASTKSGISLSTGESERVNVIGVRGGLYSNVSMKPSDLNFESNNLSIATVDSTGSISFESAGECEVIISMKSNAAIRDVVNVVCS